MPSPASLLLFLKLLLPLALFPHPPALPPLMVSVVPQATVNPALGSLVLPVPLSAARHTDGVETVQTIAKLDVRPASVNAAPKL